MIWIEIDNELPKPRQEVIVAIPVDPEIPTDLGYLKDVAYVDDDGIWRRLYSEENEEIHPTHWMTMPADPGDMNIKTRLQ